MRRTHLFFNRPEVAKAREEGWAKIRGKCMYTVERAMEETSKAMGLSITASNGTSYVKARTLPWISYRRLETSVVDRLKTE